MKAPDISCEDVARLLPHHNLSEIELIGRGGQKTVFKCKVNNESFYTLKFLEIEESKNELLSLGDETLITEDIETEVLSRAQREIEIMRQCDSPNLVKLGPIGLEFTNLDQRKLIYFSEEFINGDDLLSSLKNNGIFPVSEALNLAIDMTKAIDELWKIKMVHRDIKPQNIMRRDSGEYILLDTGIAFDTLGTEITQTFHQVGTPLFKSPEQIRGIKTELDFRSDLFLLGAVLYVILTGVHPFANKHTSRDQLTYNILMTAPKKPTEFNPSIPSEFSEIIMRLLGKQAHLRYRSCDELINKLTDVRAVI